MNTRLFLFLVGILTLISFKTAPAQLFVSDSLERHLEVSEPMVFIDDSGELQLEDLLDLSFKDSLSSGFKALKKQNPGRNVWVRMTVEKKTNFALDPIAVSCPFFSRVRIYQITESNIDSSNIGLVDIENYYTQDEDQTAIVLDFDKSNEIRLIFKVSHSFRSQMMRRFWVVFDYKSNFDKRKISNRPSKNGSGYTIILFCGILAFQLIYVFLQWYLVRKREYAYYALYITAVFIYFYLRFCSYYAENPAWVFLDASTMVHLNDVLLILPTILYLRFARAFVDLRVRDIRLYRQFSFVEVYLWICVLGQVLINTVPNDWNKLIPVMAALIAQFPFILYALIRISRQKRKLVWFLIVGSSFAYIFHLTANLSPFLFSGLMELISPLELSMTGITMEIIVFNTGLLFKARESEEERVEAQQAYIEELKTRQRLQEEYNSVRDEIASDLHDDVGSSLSSIGIYSYAAKEKLETNGKEQIKELLENIQRSAASTLNAMSDLVWATNPRNESNEKLIERVKAFGFEILGPVNCVFSMSIDPRFYAYPLNQTDRKNILLLIKEAVNNAAKYSDASEVKFAIQVSDEGFNITISDNGHGFEETDLSGGNGMRTMRKRSRELGGDFSIDSSNQGTLIRVQVKK